MTNIFAHFPSINIKQHLMLMLIILAIKQVDFVQAEESYITEPFVFESSGLQLNGIISRPKDITPSAILVIVHSFGSTDVVKDDWYRNTRKQFTSKGIAVVVWDKPGCGLSEGEFDINQPVTSSADEVVDAIAEIRKQKIAGSDRIGLWGSSRAGWIAPLAIARDSSIKFWVSISGTDGYENWGYLLRANLALENVPEADIELIHNEWIVGNQLVSAGASYDEYLSATRLYRSNGLVQKLTGNAYSDPTPGSEEYSLAEKEYLKNQKKFMSYGYEYDNDTGLPIVIKDFDQLLSKITAPVLALFGAKDKNVDWRKTKALYENTLGHRKTNNLTVKVFVGADHAMLLSKTGGFLESQRPDYWKNPLVEGFYETTIDWLCSEGFCKDSNGKSY